MLQCKPGLPRTCGATAEERTQSGECAFRDSEKRLRNLLGIVSDGPEEHSTHSLEENDPALIGLREDFCGELKQMVHTLRISVRTFPRSSNNCGPPSQRILVLAEEDETSEASETGDVLFEGGAELVPGSTQSDVSSPGRLYACSSSLAAFEVVALESSELGLLEDVGVRGADAGSAEVDLPPSFVRLVAKEWDVHSKRL